MKYSYIQSSYRTSLKLFACLEIKHRSNKFLLLNNFTDDNNVVLKTFLISEHF